VRSQALLGRGTKLANIERNAVRTSSLRTRASKAVDDNALRKFEEAIEEALFPFFYILSYTKSQYKVLPRNTPFRRWVSYVLLKSVKYLPISKWFLSRTEFNFSAASMIAS
jgi:hypothetical protein